MSMDDGNQYQDFGADDPGLTSVNSDASPSEDGGQTSDEPRVYSEEEYAALGQKVEDITKQYSDARTVSGRQAKEIETLKSENENMRSQRDKVLDDIAEASEDEKLQMTWKTVKDERKRLADWESSLSKKQEEMDSDLTELKATRFERNVKQVATEKNVEFDQLLAMVKDAEVETDAQIKALAKFCQPVKVDSDNPNPDKATSDKGPQSRTVPGKPGKPVKTEKEMYPGVPEWH